MPLSVHDLALVIENATSAFTHVHIAGPAVVHRLEAHAVRSWDSRCAWSGRAGRSRWSGLRRRCRARWVRAAGSQRGGLGVDGHAEGLFQSTRRGVVDHVGDHDGPASTPRREVRRVPGIRERRLRRRRPSPAASDVGVRAVGDLRATACARVRASSRCRSRARPSPASSAPRCQCLAGEPPASSPFPSVCHRRREPLACDEEDLPAGP